MIELRVGGVYRTRDGRRVDIISGERDDTYSFVGRFNQMPDDLDCWTATGDYVDGKESGADIVSEWPVTDQPKAEQPDERALAALKESTERRAEEIRESHGHVSLRDRFAMAALQGMYSNPRYDDVDYPGIASLAYKQADACLKARKGDGQ